MKEIPARTKSEPGRQAPGGYAGRSGFTLPAVPALQFAKSGTPVIQRMDGSDYEGLCHAWGKSTVIRALQNLGKTKEQASRQETFAELDRITSGIVDAAITTEVDQMRHGGQYGEDFQAWLSNGTTPTEMNCWEYVLYIAVKIGGLSRKEVQNAHDDDSFDQSEKVVDVFNSNFVKVDMDDLGELSVGDAIIVNRAERHVLISLGGAFVADLGTWNMAQVRTLKEVVASQTNNARLAHDDFRSPGGRCVDKLTDSTKDMELSDWWTNGYNDLPQQSVAGLRLAMEEGMKKSGVKDENIKIMLGEFDKCGSPAFYFIPFSTWVQGIKGV